MISVIVPVYNVEPYLRKCLDSIVGQTYRDLEILVIDDGSTDGSGAICDEYIQDGRVRVFHTENRGLSAARNLGLDNATGDWIGFVDSDDWIEPDMYEVLLRKAEETGADIVECGYYNEYPNEIVERGRKELMLSGNDALEMLLKGNLSNSVWNKLWKKRCFATIRYPIGRIYEDVATTYLVFYSAKSICSISDCKYHYYWRPSSLSRRRDMRNLIGHWVSDKERYEFLYNKVCIDLQSILLCICSRSIVTTWMYYYDCAGEERKRHKDSLIEMNRFSKSNIPLFGEKGWSWKHRICVCLTHFNNRISLRVAWIMKWIGKRVYNLSQ